jgi:protein-L-isoaspartate O-methyltransferase
MVQYIARTGVQCYSIEIDPALYARAKEILKHRSNIRLVLGDSGKELPKLLAEIAETGDVLA